MDNLRTFLDQLLNCVPYISIAVLGSLVRWLNNGMKGGVWALFVSTVSAGFLSLIVGLSAEYLQLQQSAIFFISGMIGFMGGNWILKQFENKLIK